MSSFNEEKEKFEKDAKRFADSAFPTALEQIQGGYSLFENGIVLKKEYPETAKAREALHEFRAKTGWV